MLNVELKLDKDDQRFARDYLKSGFAKSEDEMVRHAILWFYWRAMPKEKTGKKLKLSKAEMKRRTRFFLEGIVTAYGLVCTAEGLVGNKAQMEKARRRIEKIRMER